ncbi:uncharacterized protein Gem3 [Drosophila virilis]|uniref:RNA helicase n=1 Tax=Drosophila virilis TaxID=7244 RepID=B4LES6_DROVI|nr:probable ATP-dependent RNA helicase ddx20 [Drosophila virilis]EDW70183.1 uncharacterized protein Dvir_GJ11703 [Drosophila virilis]
MESALAHDLENTEQRTSDVAAGSVSFEELNLNKNLTKCLKSHKFLTPTKIQAAAIPIAIAGMDLLVQSKSGTGKTLIYVLAALQKMDKSVPNPQALIIVPTRELAIQVEDTVNGLANKLRNKNAYLGVSFIGGTDVKRDRMRMARGRIVVGTPGRLIHLMQNKVFNTSAIKLLVLDEADQLYSTDSLQKDVQTILASLQPGSQIIACSATYPDALDERLAKLMNKPVLVSNSERATVLLGVRQFVYELPEQANSMQEMMAKLAALHKIFAQLSYEQAILFASSQSRADSFRNYLQRDGVECDLMSGAMKQSDRLETFQAYRSFKMRTIVATDLMARGVDSSHANLVINLDPPNDLVTYLHRIGRAGRFGAKGIAITFISSPQQCVSFKRIIADAGTGMSVLQFPVEKREGFNFWDYDSYDFPYYLKTEAYEQEEGELKRIKQRWKPPSYDEQLPDTVEIGEDHSEADNTVDIDIQEQTEYLPKGSVNQELVENDKPIEEIDIIEEQAREEENHVTAIEVEQVSTQIQNVEEQIKEYRVEPAGKDETLNIDNTAAIHDTQIIMDNKENVSNNQAQVQNIDKTENVSKIVAEQFEKPPELRESPIELIELTPSVELPAAAPNSINTKTYCLVAPTERSSTTLHPLGISNTVDDASSIISDSMENDYDSDASYSSCYSESDVHNIWRHALTQQKLQKRRLRNAGRHIYHFNWRRNFPKTKHWTCESGKNAEEQSQEWLDEPSDKEQLPEMNKGQSERRRKVKITRLLTLITKKHKFLHLLQKFTNFSQIKEHLTAYIEKGKSDIQLSDKWIEQLYDAMRHLYYVDHSKPKHLKKHTLPDRPNLENYNRLMEIIRGHSCPQQPLSKLSVHVNQQLNIPPANGIDENGNAGEAFSENSESGSSYVPPEDRLHANDDISENESVGADSLEPYSSSGFVESAESASSGIDTSQYDTNSSMVLESDESEGEESSTNDEEDDVETDEHSNASNTDSSSLSTLTAESDNANESESESENEEQDEESSPDTSGTNASSVSDAADELALAQARWQYLFQMQYQFIANYVTNYLATYQRQN